MRWFFCLLLFITLLVFSACKEESLDVECLDAKLEQWGMVAFEDQEMGCKSFMELYQYKGADYFLYGNHCADLELNPEDCQGNQLCGTLASNQCEDFFLRAEFIAIVGIQE